jgi:hypothetical protein
MTLTQKQRHSATQFGSAAGTAAAGWAFDGNDAYRAHRAARCIALSYDGDPEWYDDFGPAGAGWLSGEWADGDTPRSVAAECGVVFDDIDAEGWLTADVDELADLYESAADAAYETEVLRVAHTLAQKP